MTGGMSCAAESRSFAPVILFQEMTSSMASVRVVATMRSQIVCKCWRDRIRFLVILRRWDLSAHVPCGREASHHLHLRRFWLWSQKQPSKIPTRWAEMPDPTKRIVKWIIMLNTIKPGSSNLT